MSLIQFPRYPLTFGPTPIHPLPRLTAHLDASVQLWAKREDCNSGIGSGGNKLRKLEYIIPDALRQGCDTLVTLGGVQSNHTRQVAAVAAALGLRCVLIQGKWVDHQGIGYGDVGNPLLSRIYGAELIQVEEPFSLAVRGSWDRILEKIRNTGGKPYPIPVGASDHRLGGLGYAAFAEELRTQEASLGFSFDFLVVASASGSTQAGMLAGFAGDRPDRCVVGIDVTGDPLSTKAQIIRIRDQTLDLLGSNGKAGGTEVILHEAFSGPSYGIPSEATIQAIKLCARLEGIITDPVYEGKSMHGLIDLVRRGYFPAGSRVLYVHLGGTPAINAYHAEFQDREGLRLPEVARGIP